jgi:membrane protein implicated in regulation of membrane protease activity
MTTTHRVLLTVLILAGALLFMVLPWIFLFRSPEQYAGWAMAGVVLAVALHLFLSRRKRRQELEQLLESEANDGPAGPDPP